MQVSVNPAYQVNELEYTMRKVCGTGLGSKSSRQVIQAFALRVLV